MNELINFFEAIREAEKIRSIALQANRSQEAEVPEEYQPITEE